MLELCRHVSHRPVLPQEWLCGLWNLGLGCSDVNVPCPGLFGNVGFVIIQYVCPHSLSWNQPHGAFRSQQPSPGSRAFLTVGPKSTAGSQQILQGLFKHIWKGGLSLVMCKPCWWKAAPCSVFDAGELFFSELTMRTGAIMWLGRVNVSPVAYLYVEVNLSSQQ